MAIDSASSPIPKMPPAAGSDLSTVMPDEQTPLLDGGKSMEGKCYISYFSRRSTSEYHVT